MERIIRELYHRKHVPNSVIRIEKNLVMVTGERMNEQGDFEKSMIYYDYLILRNKYCTYMDEKGENLSCPVKCAEEVPINIKPSQISDYHYKLLISEMKNATKVLK